MLARFGAAFPFSALLILVGLLGAAPARAGDDLAALQELAEVQQTRIAALQARLASQGGEDQSAQRAEALRAQIREVLSDAAFRESLVPTMLQAGYDSGFFIRSSDDAFALKFNFSAQFRWIYYHTGERNRYTQPRLRRDDRTGLDIQRIRLIYKGHVYSPDLTFYFQLRGDAPGGYNISIRDAYVNYRFSDPLQFRAGIYKTPATLARITSAQNLQFVDRPLIEAVYGLNRTLGAMIWGTTEDKRLEYALSVSNAFTSASNRTITSDPPEEDGNPALAFRAVWHALGDDPGRDMAYESDLEYHERPALLFAFHYAFTEDDGDRRNLELPFPRQSVLDGAFGVTRSVGTQVNQFGLAAAYKYRGFSARGEYILRLIDPRRAGRAPFTPWWLLTGDDSTTAQHGAYVQCGYFLPIPGLERKLEVAARVGVVTAHAERVEYAWEYTGGVNYYITKKTKLQANVTKISEVPVTDGNINLANVNDEPLMFRLQLQVGF